VGTRTHIKITVAVATPYLLCSSFDKLRTNGDLLLISWFDKALLSAVEVLTTNGLFKPSLVVVHAGMTVF